MKDWVYFIHNRDKSAIKIGASKDPYGRLLAFSTGSPSILTLIAIFPSKNARQEEQELHRLFSAHHLTGEWFRDQPIITHIARNQSRLVRGFKPTSYRPRCRSIARPKLASARQQILFRLPSHLVRDLKIRAAEENVSMQALIERALITLLKTMPPKRRKA